MTPFHRADRLAFTPIVTPFQDGGIAFDALEAAVDRQIVAGLDGIIVGDVVGEGQMLDSDEHDALLRTCLGRGKRHLSVIAATGTNCTKTTMERSRRAEALGADALLVTVPYYSKPGLRGVIDHFRQVASAVSIPVIIDDDPGRTAKDYGPPLLEGLQGFQNIAGVCHGTDRLAHFAGLSPQLRSSFLHLTRDDATLVQFLDLGGNGGVSPVANVIPSPVQTMVSLGGFGSMADAVMSVVAAVGRDDVAALKEAVSFIHQTPVELRLPLVASEPETVIRIRRALAPFARCEGQERVAA
jgi:4-hydroxy-tetrahydrodipicolinate synthase